MDYIYGIKTCDKVKKAVSWLQNNGVEHQYVDLRSKTFDNSKVDDWLRQVGSEQLLNKKSRTWRNLDESITSNLQDSHILSLLVEYPTLIKRPILESSDKLIIDFDEEKYLTFYKRER